MSTANYSPTGVAGFPSAVSLLEVAHEGHERVDAGFRERVIDRRAHAADRAVALEAVETCRGRFRHEHLLEIFARQPERHVHQRPAVLRGRAAIETRAIDLR